MKITLSHALTGTVVLAAAGAGFADVRNYTFLYESTLTEEGQFEYQQWVTWETDKPIDSEYHRFDFRHEFQFGLTDHSQISFFVPDWHYETGSTVDDGAEFDDVAAQGIFSFTDPEQDQVGFALLGEARFGDEIIAAEGRAIVDKHFGQFKAAYNLGFEASWTGTDYQHDNGLLTNAFGVSYELAPEFSLGAEFVHEAPIIDWDDFAKSVAWLGPNASYQQETWWITVTPLFQVTDISAEPDFQTRLLFGISF